jgi:hypothetical protein
MKLDSLGGVGFSTGSLPSLDSMSVSSSGPVEAMQVEESRRSTAPPLYSTSSSPVEPSPPQQRMSRLGDPAKASATDFLGWAR